MGRNRIRLLSSIWKKDTLREFIEKAQKNGEYLPHFPVLRPDKSTTKVRIVFNRYAKFNGISRSGAIHLASNVVARFCECS